MILHYPHSVGISILKSWKKVPIEVNKVYDFFNLTREAISNDTKFSLKHTALTTIKQSKVQLPDLRNSFFDSVKDLNEGLIYNLKLKVNAINTLTYNASDGNINKATVYLCTDAESAECKFVDWANKNELKEGDEAYFKNVYLTKYNNVYELGYTIFTSINGS